MPGPEGNSKFCFPSNLNVSRGGAKRPVSQSYRPIIKRSEKP